MKKLFFLLALALLTISVQAQDGKTCETAIPVDTAYTGSFGEGDYWFTAETSALPLYFYFYPEDTTIAPPTIYLDLTCTEGVYDDPKVAEMVKTADKYFGEDEESRAFPMRNNLKKAHDEQGRLFYYIVYDRNYRDMLYGQGVTYSIPAYVRLSSHGSANVEIKSTSVNTQCAGVVNKLAMNTALPFAPIDSAYVYQWPLGEWIEKNYTISWQGEKPMKMYTSLSCNFDRFQGTYDAYEFPKDSLVMTPRRTSNIINEIYDTQFFVRLYPQSDGVLRIAEFERIAQLQEFIVAGIYAAIDHEALTITAVLPKGTNRTEALNNAQVVYTSYNGETYSYVNRKTVLRFGTADKYVDYTLKISVSTDEGSTDATLKTIKFDGDDIYFFDAGKVLYDSVEVASLPVVSAEANAGDKAQVVVTQAKAVPGTATIVVTAEAGNTQTYTLKFIKARNSDNTLSQILIDGKPLEGFDAKTLQYRMEVTKLPQVSAVANDSKAKVTIDQPKAVPGYALIYVEAENTQVQTYSINFVQDKRQEMCAEAAPLLELNKTVALQEGANSVVRIPIKEWAGSQVALTWNQDSDVKLYISSSCLFDPANPDETLVGTYDITVPKSEQRHVVYFTAAELTNMSKKSIDGSLYVFFQTQAAGTVAAMQYVENCLNQSTYIPLPSTLELPFQHLASNVYNIYCAEWKNKQVDIEWDSDISVELWFAYECKFNLTETNRYVLRHSYIAANKTLSLTADEVNELIGDRDFLYLKFNKQLPAGTLFFKVTGSQSPTGLDDMQDGSNPAANSASDSAAKARKLIRDGHVIIQTADGKQFNLLGIEL